MKRTLGVMLLGCLCGCPSIDPTTPRKYLCTDRQSSSTQCPGDWRCTRDGFCADPDVGQELSCQVDDDCTGLWRCALTGLCVNPGVGRPLPCDDRHACPGGWRCGVIGQCFDPDAGAALPCQTERDCPTDWHCGAGPVCYELAKATSVVCRVDAGTDCAPGWRCGLEARCHLVDAGAPLLCERDSDCEATWRCNAAGRCADTALDALRSTAMTGAVAVSPVPTFVPDDVRAVSVSIRTSLFGSTGRVAAFAGDGGLTVVAFNASAALFDAGSGRPMVPGVVARIAAPGVQAVSAQLAPLVWAAAGTQLTGYRFSAPGQLTPVFTLAPGFAITRFRLLDSSVLAAFDSRSVVALTDTGTLTPLYVAPAGDAGLITDVAVLRARLRRADAGLAPQSQVLVVLTSEGALASPWVGSGPTGEWVPVEFSSSLRLTSIAPTPGSSSQEATVIARDSFQKGFAALTRETLPPSGARLTPWDDTTRALMATTVLFMPPTCGGDPVDVVADQAGTWWATHCVVDGGVVVEYIEVDAGLAPVDVALRDGHTFATDNSGLLVHAGRGAALVSSDLAADPGLPLVPLGESERVDTVLGTASTPEVLTAPSQADPVQCTQGILDYCRPLVAAARCFSGNSPWLWCRAPALGPLYRVTGQPDLELVGLRAPPLNFAVFKADLSNPVEDLTRIVATTTIDFGEVGATATARTFDGGLQMFVGASDRLYWADLSRRDSSSSAELPNTNAFRFAVVPQPGATVTSVAALEGAGSPDGGTHFAEGYLVASGRVHHFIADNPVVWLSDLQNITTAEAVSVWADGRRGRVAFRDGSVFGLPSRVPLSGPISPGASSVVAIESTCGQTFALTTLGLFQLRTSAATLATWERIELRVPDSVLSYGRLIAEEAGLYVALPGNDARRVTGFPCAR